MESSIATVWGRVSFLLGGVSWGRRTRPGGLLQATLETMDHGCIVIDARLRILGSNRRAAEVLDMPTAMVAVGRSFKDIITLAANRGDYGEGDPDELIALRVASASSGEAHNFDRVQPGGTVLNVRAQPLPEGGLVITYTDITETRRLEGELRRSEARYALAIEGARSAIWDWDMVTGQMTMSDRISEILGLSAQDVTADPNWWPGRVHPEDQETYRGAIRDHLSGRTDAYEAEYRVRAGTGEYRWVADRGKCVRDDTGRAVRMAGSVDDITDRKDAENALKKAATTDALTGAFNRRKFMEMASVELYRAQRYGTDVAAAIFDLDHFKRINDTYGHASGDQCLSSFVNLVYALIRQSDVLARYGGEEFVLLMPQSDLQAGHLLADRIRTALADLKTHGAGEPMSFTVSGGVAAFRPGDSLETLLARADDALYEAKRGGRNRIVTETMAPAAPCRARPPVMPA